MRIWQISDLHYSAADLEDGRVPGQVPDADVAIVLGDLGGDMTTNLKWCASVVRPKMPVVYVPGNHDFHWRGIIQASAEGRRTAAAMGIHFVDQDTVIVAGARFVGGTFWSDYALNCAGDALRGKDNVRRNMEAALGKADYKRIMHCERTRETLRPWHTAAIHDRTRGHIRRTLSKPFDGPTVVVTHHAVLPDSTQPGFENSPTQPSYTSDQRALIEWGKPAIWAHGHLHAASRRRIGDTEVVCNPHGFAHEDPGFDWGLVLTV